ncbi:hypothetical protein EYC84_005274 [Monilinia fructicola]|uniref:Uncharacterized protein n=1 Tax=Monilinia fructicola TaxID=38448 RepID=A0A5M9JYX3_MONFR|nr:hypothetical protein EYC84_005274 [Monilinia fructicola]
MIECSITPTSTAQSSPKSRSNSSNYSTTRSATSAPSGEAMDPRQRSKRHTGSYDGGDQPTSGSLGTPSAAAAAAAGGIGQPKVVQTAFIHKAIQHAGRQYIRHLYHGPATHDSFVMSPNSDFAKVLSCPNDTRRSSFLSSSSPDFHRPPFRPICLSVPVEATVRLEAQSDGKRPPPPSRLANHRHIIHHLPKNGNTNDERDQRIRDSFSLYSLTGASQGHTGHGPDRDRGPSSLFRDNSAYSTRKYGTYFNPAETAETRRRTRGGDASGRRPQTKTTSINSNITALHYVKPEEMGRTERYPLGINYHHHSIHYLENSGRRRAGGVFIVSTIFDFGVFCAYAATGNNK